MFTRNPHFYLLVSKKKKKRTNIFLNEENPKSPQGQAAWHTADVLKSGERKMQFLFLVPNAIQESITEQIACQAGNPARLQLWAHLRSGPPPSPELGSQPRPQVSALRKRQLGEDAVPVFISTRTTPTPLSNDTEKTNKRKEKVRQGRLKENGF